jgi:uncharacterized phage protein gp47/JayE
MQLSLQNFSTLVQNMAASVQSSALKLLDLTVGSTLRAVLEANASLALWMQWLILQVLQMTRAATCTAGDLDSWMADFSLARLPASPASGTVTVSRYTPTLTALVSVGALVRTADGTQTFSITADSSIPSFSSTQSGYVLAAGVGSLDVPVVAVNPGVSGNVQIGAISLLATAMPGVDTVTNAIAFENGLDAESDAAFRSRFQNYIASRSRATLAAIGYAVSSIQQGLNYTIQENVDTTGTASTGNFVVTVDDGSGSPAATLLQTISSAVDAVRPIGSTFSVRPPTVIVADIDLAIAVAGGAVKSAISGQVGTAIAAYIEALPIGGLLSITRLAQIAYDASGAVTNVTSIQINQGFVDLAPALSAVVKPGAIAVN